MANGAQERIRAQSTSLTGKNAHLATASEPNVTLPVLSVEEWVGFLSEDELTSRVRPHARQH